MKRLRIEYIYKEQFAKEFDTFIKIFKYTIIFNNKTIFKAKSVDLNLSSRVSNQESHKDI